MPASDHSHFDASGPVGRYWLANGVGFSVCDADGRKLGTVAHVVVDRRQQGAERLIVRRSGLIRRPRYVAIDPRAVESVLPDSELFVVPAEAGAVAASRATVGQRVRRVALAVSTAIVALGRALRPAVAALDRRLALAAEATLRASRRGASAVAAATALTTARTRREAPRLGAWLSARAREVRRLALVVLRFLDEGARSFARLLGDLTVLAAVGAAALWRRAEGALARQRSAPREEHASETRAPELPDPAEPDWRRDTDAPLARERSDDRSARRSRR